MDRGQVRVQKPAHGGARGRGLAGGAAPSLQGLRRQRGIGLLGILIIVIMVGVFITAAIKIAPGYIEYFTVRDVVMRVAEEYKKDIDTTADIRRKLADFFNTNQIYGLKPQDIKIERRDGEVVIDAGYEQRVPLFWRIDLVMKYDDLVFQAGESYSD
jgi:hypothetical protein